MRYLVWYGLGLAAALAAPAAHAQAGRPESHPMAVVDSVYAVRVAADRWAEALRGGEPGTRTVLGPETAAAAARLHEAARGRKRAAPHRDLGTLWDFRLDLGDIQPDGKGRMRATGRAFLARDPEGGAPVVMVFERQGREWIVVEEENVGAWLAAQTGRFQQGRAR